MKKSGSNNRKGIIGRRRGVLLLAVCGGGALLAGIAAVWPRSAPEPATLAEAKSALTAQNVQALANLPPEERRKKLQDYGKALSADFVPPRPGERSPQPAAGGRPGGPVGMLDEATRKVVDGLGQEDREAFRRGVEENMRRHFEGMMKQKVAEFFKASPEQQQRLLAEEVARMKQMDEQRAKDEAEGKKRVPPPGFATESRDKREDHMRGMLNRTDPQTRVQMQEYFSRVHQAMGASKG